MRLYCQENVIIVLIIFIYCFTTANAKPLQIDFDAKSNFCPGEMVVTLNHYCNGYYDIVGTETNKNDVNSCCSEPCTLRFYLNQYCKDIKEEFVEAMTRPSSNSDIKKVSKGGKLKCSKKRQQCRLSKASARECKKRYRSCKRRSKLINSSKSSSSTSKRCVCCNNKNKHPLMDSYQPHEAQSPTKKSDQPKRREAETQSKPRHRPARIGTVNTVITRL